MAEIPTADHPSYLVAGPGAGYIYRAVDGTVILEHCADGLWGGCILRGCDDLREAQLKALAHLDRAGKVSVHRHRRRQVLNGTYHAGGGVKGPVR